ncbi:MAG: 3-isopropylmalate dehydrogenase [Gammaproteobacteria bacterium]|jgi:3-isopropylmalate dehydrogenase|nr:3-isopropylmalate dehydrogenase [Gammaproteobacteria bacterium]
MSKRILLLPGDGIGPEILAEARNVLEVLIGEHGLDATLQEAPVGGAAVDACGDPLPADTLELARAADALLLGAVGGPAWDQHPRHQRPETGLLRLRAGLGLFANLRPALLHAPLASASTLRPEVVEGLDLLIVRELTGGIYFGEPRGIRESDGQRQGFNTLVYSESEIERIAHVAFRAARERRKAVCSVDKANVLESSELWREVVSRVGGEYPDVALRHMYVDNAAMQLVRDPSQFDVLLTGNMFGDILSDIAATLTGSIGMLPSASLDANRKGLYEPIHGSAPDIAGKDVANPLATILSVALMLRYSFAEPDMATYVEQAVSFALSTGLRTADIAGEEESVGTAAMGEAVVAAMLAFQH